MTVSYLKNELSHWGKMIKQSRFALKYMTCTWYMSYIGSPATPHATRPLEEIDVNVVIDDDNNIQEKSDDADFEDEFMSDSDTCSD